MAEDVSDDANADHASNDKNTVATLIISDDNLVRMYIDIIQGSPITIERKEMYSLREN